MVVLLQLQPMHQGKLSVIAFWNLIGVITEQKVQWSSHPTLSQKRQMSTKLKLNHLCLLTCSGQIFPSSSLSETSLVLLLSITYNKVATPYCPKATGVTNPLKITSIPTGLVWTKFSFTKAGRPQYDVLYSFKLHQLMSSPHPVPNQQVSPIPWS